MTTVRNSSGYHSIYSAIVYSELHIQILTASRSNSTTDSLNEVQKRYNEVMP